MMPNQLLCKLLNDNESDLIELIDDDCLLTDEEKRAGCRIHYKKDADGNGVISYSSAKRMKVLYSVDENISAGDIVVVMDGVWEEYYEESILEKVFFVAIKDVRCILPQ